MLGIIDCRKTLQVEQLIRRRKKYMVPNTERGYFNLHSCYCCVLSHGSSHCILRLVYHTMLECLSVCNPHINNTVSRVINDISLSISLLLKTQPPVDVRPVPGGCHCLQQ